MISHSGLTGKKPDVFNTDWKGVALREFFMTTTRVGFSVWTDGDLPEAQELWGNAAVTKYISANGNMTDEQIKQRLRREIETYTTYKIQYWPIYWLENTEFIGCCGLRPYNNEKNIVEIGFHIREKFWGKGIAYEASYAVIGYAFAVLKRAALFAGHNPNNIVSAHLLKKLGFSYTHDEFYQPTGLLHPSYLMTKQQFEEQKHSL